MSNLTFKREKLTQGDRWGGTLRKVSIKDQSGNPVGTVSYMKESGWLYQALESEPGAILGIDDMKEIVDFCDEQDAADNDDPGYEPPNVYIPGYGWTVM